MRGQRGQTAAEYLGILVVIAAIVAALATSEIGTRIGDGVRGAICSIAGTSCDAPAQASQPTGPDGDADGIPDASDPSPADPDADDDGLSDGAEQALGTDPRRGDSDDDGASDLDEYDRRTDPTRGIAPLTEENQLEPWTRVGLTEDQWRDLEEEVLDDVNPDGLEGFLFGPSAAGVTLDENGELALIEISQNGLPVGPLLKTLTGAGKALSASQALARAASRLPSATRAALAARGVIPATARGVKPPAPPTQPGVALGELDDLGRATGASATITKDMLGTGSRAAVDTPGFLGRAGVPPHARGHLIARSLGGTGKDGRNLVTLYQNPVNTPVMSGFERTVREAVRAGQTVKYTARPIYKGSESIPSAVTLSARGSGGLRLDVTVLNRAP